MRGSLYPWRIMIKLQQLAHALALGHHGNFHRAAAAQHLSQPALSRSIQSLEEGLGVPLFDRQSAAVTPTLYGEALLRRAAVIIEEAEELEREIRLLQGIETGTFAVAMGAYASELSGRQAVGELMRRHPNLACKVLHGSWRVVADQVLARSVDLGFAELSSFSGDERLQVEPIGQHELVLCCRPGHPLLGLERLSKADLDVYPLVSIRVPARGAGLMPGKSRIEETTGDIIPHKTVDDLATAQAIIMASDAFGVLAPLQIESGGRRGDLCILPFRAPWLRLNYGFIYLRNRLLSPAAQLFMTLVRDLEADLADHNRHLMEDLFSGVTPSQ